MKKLILIILLLSLAGCGFHLRGQQELPPQLHRIYLQSYDPYSPLTKQIRQTLHTVGVVIVQQPQAAPVTLQIISEQSGQQVTGQGVSGQLTTYMLSYTMVYQLLDTQGRPLQEAQMITTTHYYSIGANQLLGDTQIQQNFQNTMRNEVIDQLLYRLNSENTRYAVTSRTIK